jgi:hypothetical protein
LIHGVSLSCHRTSKENVTLAPGTISCGSALMHELEAASVPAAASSHVRAALHGSTSNLVLVEWGARGAESAVVRSRNVMKIETPGGGATEGKRAGIGRIE